MHASSADSILFSTPTDGIYAHLDVFRRPCVEVDGADLGDVHAEIAMDARAADAQEYPEVQRRPARTCLQQMCQCVSICMQMGQQTLGAALGTGLVLRQL